ncbi:MAG: hypothetical protein M3Q79_04310 [bacterium]|nr:hypothetical protein [bacterium]
MKKKDRNTIIIVVLVSAFVAFFAAKFIIGSPDKKQQTAEIVEPISAEFTRPDSTVFNENAINPTQLIKIGENANTTPFRDGN